MAVIKRHQAVPLLKEAIVLDLGDVGRQAARMIAAAEDKALKIVNDSQARANTLVEGAEQRGHQQGYEKGLAQGLEDGLTQGTQQGHDEAHAQASARLAQLQKNWLAGLTAWEAHQEQFARDSRDAALKLALRLTEKIIHRVIELDPTAVVDQVGAALAHVMESAQVIIRICPGDRELVEESLPALMAEFSHLTSAKIVEDASITQGGCIVNCGRGSIDGTLETQLSRVIDLIFPQGEEPLDQDIADDDSLATAVDQAISQETIVDQQVAEQMDEQLDEQDENDLNDQQDPHDQPDAGSQPDGRTE